MVTRGFGPGANGPLLLAGPADAVASADPSGVAFDERAGRSRAQRRHARCAWSRPTSAPQAQATTDLVHRLRDELPPGVMVGGTGAALVDQSELVAGRLPLFIGGVLVMSFLLLLCAFRSPLIALKAGAMNLLSVGAAYGVIALFAAGRLLRRR